MSRHEISGDDLFGKYTEGNLNKKQLKKMKKGELVETIASNLPFLVDAYFGSFQKKERKFLNDTYILVGSEAYFMRPLLKIMGVGKKKKNKIDLTDIPKGLHVILMDSMDNVRATYNDRIRKFSSDNKSKEVEDLIADIKEKAQHQFEQLNDIITLLIKKDTKKLVKLGIKESYATRIARCFVPTKYLTKHNVGKYFQRLNRTLVDVQRFAMVRTEEIDEDGNNTFVNDAGINLALDDNIMDVYELFFAGVDRDVYLAALTSVMLEIKNRNIDKYTKPQIDMYNAITRVVAELLEGNCVLNITGEKLSKKELKKEAISKNEIKKIMKIYSVRRAEDYRKGYDAPRRIVLSNLSEEAYPRLVTAFAKENNTTVREVLEGNYEDDERERNEERNRQKQQNQNQNNNGNNRNDGRNQNNGRPNNRHGNNNRNRD